MSKYALKVGQSAVERLAVLDEIHAVTSSHILSGVSLPAPSRILDVGCGVGHTTIRLARHFGSQAHVVGIDREPSQIDTSKRENPSPNIEYRVGDLKDYLEQLSGYDLIYGRFVFGHNRDCIDLLGRIFANMRSGARLIFEEPDIGTARTLVGTGIIEEGSLPKAWRFAWPEFFVEPELGERGGCARQRRRDPFRAAGDF